MGSSYYVAPDGSDLNDGSFELPFQSIQRAVDLALIIASPSPVRINIAPGSYNGVSISGPIPARADEHGSRLLLVGDEGNPDKVVIRGIGSDAVSASDDASVLVAGITLTTIEAGNLIACTRRSSVNHRNCIFGPSARETLRASHFSQICARGPTTVAGASHAFAHATTKSLISFNKQLLRFQPGLHFKHYLWAAHDGTIKLDRATIEGSATGAVVAHTLGALNVAHVKGEWAGGGEPRAFNGGVISRGKLSAGQ